MAPATAPQIDSVGFDHEDYNIRSPERTKLLIKIKEVIGDAPVSPAFWACCQLADMNRLQTIAKTDRRMILACNKPLALLLLQWTQRFRDPELPGLMGLWMPPSVKEADNCKERDKYACVLTNQPLSRAAHIFPSSMLKKNPASNYTPEFWEHLYLFWDEDRVNKWKEMISPDSQNPNTGVDRCLNLISLDGTAHVLWTRGLFALKPLELSSDHKQLTVQFFWQVPGKYDIESQIDLLTEPISSKGLDHLENGCYLVRRDRDSTLFHCISSGELFTLTTKDPEKLPLPSMDLLEMQWFLQRLVGMSGAAGWPILDLDDDESVRLTSGHSSNLDDALERVHEWVAANEATGITPEMSTATPCPSVIPCH